jgi:hypothetical protein
MNTTSARPRTGVVLCCLCGVLFGLAGTDLHGQRPATAPATAAPSRDHLLGWFKMAKRATVIPIFKQEGIYYSACNRGVEVPLKPCPEGLEWDCLPSSMEGTKIGFDVASNAYYIAIEDDLLENNSDNYVRGEKQPLTKLDKAPDLLNPTAPRPASNDDFVGCYQAVWCPAIRYEIRKDGQKFLAAMQLYTSSAWRPVDAPVEIKPLPDGLGFALGQAKKSISSFTYNQTLKRFEIAHRMPNRHPAVLRIPLARVPTLPSPEAGEAPKPFIRIGIPSWN